MIWKVLMSIPYAAALVAVVLNELGRYRAHKRRMR